MRPLQDSSSAPHTGARQSIGLAAERFAAGLHRTARVTRTIDRIFASVFTAFAVHLLLARAR